MPCKTIEARRAAFKRWYDRNSVKEIARIRVNDAKRKAASRVWFDEMKSKLKCIRCGFDHPAALHFHHRDPSTKDSSLADAIRRGWSVSRMEKEIAKCDVICANCHSIEHQGHRFS